jgi:osmoprotectant transport system ATP-binding protein
MTDTPTISFRSVSKRFANASSAARGLVFGVAEGETLVLVGPSGCGKTHHHADDQPVIEPTSGQILVGGRDTSQVDPSSCGAASASSRASD